MNLVKDEFLAELMGMILGDGNLGNYYRRNKENVRKVRCNYLRIYCNIKETQYGDEINRILKKVFNKEPLTYRRPSEGIIYLEVSLKDLDRLLDLPIGDKIKNRIKISNWIYKDPKFLIACLRGLFDTDGCCYRTGGKYRIINFKNKNSALMKDVYRALEILDFHPYNRGLWDIELGRHEEVEKFFNIIRPKNIKHYRYNAQIAKVVTAGD